jgi:phage-related holin
MWCTKLLVYGIFMTIAVTIWQTLHIWNSLLSWIFWFILVTDSISIIENLEKMGYNTPFILKKYLKDYQETLKNNKKDDEK